MRLNRCALLSLLTLIYFYSFPVFAIMPGIPNLPGGADASRTSQNIQQISNTIEEVGQPLPLSQLIAKTVWTSGSVSAISPANARRQLQRGSPLYTRERVTTDNSGTGEIAFTDGSLLTLHSQTTIVLSQYRHGSNVSRGNEVAVIEVIKGGFRTVTGSIPKNNPGGYRVRTPVGSIGVRGTDYNIVYNPGTRELSVAVSSGSIMIAPVAAAPFVLTQGTPNIAAIVTSKGAQVLRSIPPALGGSSKLIPGTIDNTMPRKKNQIKVSPCP
ncbi:MAG: FecR family protein [Gammaproteobacteria bacterium]